MRAAEASGLDLFAPGHWGELRTVVDVGANAGQWSSLLLHLVRPERHVLIEPEPRAFAELERVFGKRPGVELHNVAIGDRNGVTRFRVTRDTTGASVLQPSEEMRELVGSNWTVEHEMEVPLRTLDTLLAEVAQISLLKIDVQGFEREALAGARATLTRTKFLLIELNYMPQYEGGSWLGDVHQILTQEHGFFLANASRPLCLNGHASMADGLYVNRTLVPDWVRPDFV